MDKSHKNESPDKDDFKRKVHKQKNYAKDPLKDKIGDSLRKMYDDVVNEPIPEDFLNILKSPKTQDKPSPKKQDK